MSASQWIKVNDSDDKSKAWFPICKSPAEDKTVHKTQWGDPINWGWEFNDELGKFASCVTELSPKAPNPPAPQPQPQQPQQPPAPQPQPQQPPEQTRKAIDSVLPPGFSKSQLSLVWSDDFSSSPSIDLGKWEYHLGDGSDYTGLKGWGNGELQSYTKNPENIRIENSQLVITAKRGSSGPHPTVNPKSGSCADPSITSGKLCSTRSFMHGKTPILVSARIKFPMAKGSFPAFWLIPMREYSSGTGDFGYWPLSGEIDILEHVNEEPKVQTTVIYGYPNESPQFHRGTVDFSDGSAGDWHVYHCFWSPSRVTTWVDGKQMFDKDTSNTPVNNPMNIVLNLACGGNWAGNDNLNLPCSMYVDYVTVHNVNGGGNQGPSSTPPSPSPSPPPPSTPSPAPQNSDDQTYHNYLMSIVNKYDGSIFVNKEGSCGWETVAGLARNKQRIWSVIERNHGADKNLYHLILAMGMLETKSISVSERDHEKDKLGWQTANYTFLNLNGDLISRAIPENKFNIAALGGSPLNQDTDFQIDAAIQILKGAVKNLGGIFSYCNFVRGGWSGWNSPGENWDLYRMGQFFHGLSLSLQKISANEQGVADTNSDKRFWIRVEYV